MSLRRHHQLLGSSRLVAATPYFASLLRTVQSLMASPLRETPMTSTARLTYFARIAVLTSGEGRTTIDPERLPSYSDTAHFRE